MKAIGRNLIIQKIETKSTKTDGGLLLSEKDREDIRYIKAIILIIRRKYFCLYLIVHLKMELIKFQS